MRTKHHFILDCRRPFLWLNFIDLGFWFFLAQLVFVILAISVSPRVRFYFHFPSSHLSHAWLVDFVFAHSDLSYSRSWLTNEIICRTGRLPLTVGLHRRLHFLLSVKPRKLHALFLESHYLPFCLLRLVSSDRVLWNKFFIVFGWVLVYWPLLNIVKYFLERTRLLLLFVLLGFLHYSAHLRVMIDVTRSTPWLQVMCARDFLQIPWCL